jgi:hypothetical protein
MTFASRSSSPRPADQLVRASLAILRSETRDRQQEEAVVRSMYPGDEASALLVKAAVAPGSLSSTQWAGALASSAVSDFVSGLGPVSAASQLIGSALQVDLDRYGHVRVPALIPTASLAVFVAEGREIPVAGMLFHGATLAPARSPSLPHSPARCSKAPPPKPSSEPRSGKASA